jgi:hypothetical protein
MLRLPDAAHTHSVNTVAAVPVGIATVEGQVAGIGATNRGTPHVAVAAHIEERAIAEAVAANGPLQSTGKGTCSILISCSPTIHFGLQFTLRGHTPAGRAGIVNTVFSLPERIVLPITPIIE